jgi:hypothetical protein
VIEKPSKEEEKYFARLECEKKKLEEERRRRFTLKEKKHARKLHYMKCTKCGMDHLEIDYK